MIGHADRGQATIVVLAALLAWAAAGPAPPPAQGVEAHIGFVGCSMTRDTFAGWHGINPEVWPVDTRTKNYAGASIGTWANADDPAWSDFDTMLGRFPATDTVFIQICASKAARSAEPRHIEGVVAELLTRWPAATPPNVFIGWQPVYEAGHLCNILGNDLDQQQASLERAMGTARHGIARRLGQPDGSPLGPLGPETATPCHANEAGKRLLGAQMEAWWPPPGVQAGASFFRAGSLTRIAGIVRFGLRLP